MKYLIKISNLYFLLFIVCTNINAQTTLNEALQQLNGFVLNTNVDGETTPPTFQQNLLLNKEWLFRVEGQSFVYGIMTFTSTEVMVTSYYPDNSTFVTEYEYYLSNNRDVYYFDNSKVGQITEGSYIIENNNYNGQIAEDSYINHSHSSNPNPNQSFIMRSRIVYLDEQTLILHPIGTIGSGNIIWHTADWEDPNDHDGMYDEGDSGIHGGYQIP